MKKNAQLSCKTANLTSSNIHDSTNLCLISHNFKSAFFYALTTGINSHS